MYSRNYNDSIFLYSLSVFFYYFSGSKNRPDKGQRISPDCTILDISVFDNFILADELFAKSLQGLKTCVSVNDNLCGKLVSSLESPITFDERFQITSISSFIPDSY